MRVEVVENGARPAMLTASRQNAPAGAKVLADVIHDMNFADYAIIILDWEKDALVVTAVKRYPDINRQADLEFALDMNDAFRMDNFGRDIAIEMLDHMKGEFQKKDYEARQMEGRA